MEKSEIIQLIGHYLQDKGYKEVSNKLEQESNIFQEPKEIKKIKNFIREGKFEDSIKQVLNFCEENEKKHIIPKIRLLNIFEAIENSFENIVSDKANKLAKASCLELIRRICNSKNPFDKDKLTEKCASLLFLKTKKEMKKKAKEISSIVYDRGSLIDYLDNTIFNNNKRNLLKNHFLEQKNVKGQKMIYKRDLQSIIGLVIKKQIKKCIFHNMELTTNESLSAQKQLSYFEDHLCPKTTIPYKLLATVERHNDEIINMVLGNKNEFFAIALKGGVVAIYKLMRSSRRKESNMSRSFSDILDYSFIPRNHSQISNGNEKNGFEGNNMINIIFHQQFKAHGEQITSISFNKLDTLLLTSSKDKTVKLFDCETGQTVLTIDRINHMASSACFIGTEQKLILISTTDMRVLLFDTLGNLVESFLNIPSLSTVNDLLFSGQLSLIIMNTPASKAIIIYSYPKKNEVAKLQINDTVVSLALSKVRENYLLVNSSNATPVLTLWSLKKMKLIRKYFGHRQERLNTKCGFGGEGENFLICGSENKEIYIWNRNQSMPISIILAHSASINCVIWPGSGSKFSGILISGSDDHTLKIFSNDQFSKAQLLDYSNRPRSLSMFQFSIEEGKLSEQQSELPIIDENINNNSENNDDDFSEI
jgi:WD40 repeat protein